MPNISSAIKDNYNRGNVGDFLKENIEKDSELSIVSAYFTIYAYQYLKDKLNDIKSLNFLFGEPSFINTLDPSKVNNKNFVIEEGALLISPENRLQQKAISKECSEWIKRKVNIKSLVKPKFLHGKLYHIEQKNGAQKALIGSSNFTVKGLGLSEHKNMELNMVINDERDKNDVLNWFQELWNNDTGLVEDVKDEVLKYLEKLYVDNDPEFIYYKTLYHIFKDYLDEQKTAENLERQTGFLDTQIWNMLYEFQKDAVKGAINKIEKYNGAIIADSVGLGKTFEALAIIKYFELKNYKVLVLVPKKIRNNWSIYLGHNNSELNILLNDRFNYTLLNHTDLSRDGGLSGDINLENINWGNFDLIVIDESHNFRNASKSTIDENRNTIRKSRYEKLMNDIIKSGVNTKVLLLSATPVNNNLKDLRNQIYFITQGNDNALYEKTGIKNIGETIKGAQTVFTNWADTNKNPDRSIKILLEKLDSSFFKLLDELTIARSRKHIKTYYKSEIKKIGAFPKRLPVISKFPKIATNDEFPSYDKINQEIMTYKLSLFNPTAYVKPERQSFYEEKAGKKIKGFDQKTREYFLIGMMKVNFLKRLESSIESFEISLKRTIDKIKSLEEKIYNFKNKKENKDEIDINDFNLDTDDEDVDDALENTIGTKLKFYLGDLDLDLWLKDIKQDKDALTVLYNSAKTVTPDKDNKLKILKELIRNKIENPINNGNKKVIIFTAFADTAKYLYENLIDFIHNKLKLHIALVTGTGDNKTTLGKLDYDHILTNFSPISKDRHKMKGLPQDEEIDVLIATDCISEGQNLQDCDYLVNYDIHWNPVRIIQRFGRIDRIGSKNKKIQMVNFWPTEDLDNYINLKERVEARMALVDITATGEENLLEPNKIEDLIGDDLKFRNKQLKRLKDEVLDLEDLDENISLTDFTLDDFRIALLNFIQKNREKLENAPLGLYAVVPSPSGEYSNLSNFDSIDEKTKEIIKPGIIYCLSKKNNVKDSSKVNPLYPYFLVYIREDGTVRFNFTNVKQILEIYKLLCDGVDKPYKKLCEIFDSETDNGTKMEKENKLLQKAINDINTIFRKRVNQRLVNSRDAVLIPTSAKIEQPDNFELITWLVIK